MEDRPLHTIGEDLTKVVDDIGEIRDDIHLNAWNMLTRGQAYAANADSYIGDIAKSLIDPVFGADPKPLKPLDPPDRGYGNEPLPAFEKPDAVVPVDWGDGFKSTLSDFSFALDQLDLPDAPPDVSVVIPPIPVVTFGDAPTKPTIDTTLSLPDRPDLNFPSPPVLHGVTLPILPVVALPTLDIKLPEWNEPKPDMPNLPVAVGDTTLDKAKFDEFVHLTLNGVPQTLLTVTQEEVGRISDLHRDTAQRDIEAVFEEFSGRGFTAPPGALGRRTDVIRAEANAKIRLASRDVATARMQMEVDVYKANLSTGADLVKKELEFDLQEKRLVFEIYTEFGKQMISLYNAEVAVFNAKQSGYQALVDVYKAQIQGELSKVELFKAQVEGVKATLEIDNTAMRGYESQLKGLSTAVDVYRAVVEAAKTELDAKAKQMDMFRSEVDAYSAQISAGKARYSMYETEITAAMAPLQIYEQKVKAYAVGVDASKAKAQVAAIESEQRIAREDAAIKGFVAALEGKSKENAAKFETAKQALATQQLAIDYEVKKKTVQLDVQRIDFEKFKTQATFAISEYEAALKLWEVQGGFAQKKADMRLEAARASAQVAGQLASAAMAGFHVQESISASAQVGFSGSSSGSWQYGKSESKQLK